MTWLGPAFRWLAAVLSVPFGVLALLKPNPEKLRLDSQNLALPLPKPLLGFLSTFSHLTMVTHECICWHLFYGLLRDHGLVSSETSENGALFRSTLAVAGLFVTTVFWGCMMVDPLLFIHPIDLGFPEGTPTGQVRARLYHMLWAPRDAAETGFYYFMRYIHTVCTLAAVVDIVFTGLPVQDHWQEVKSVASYCTKYLALNLFSWGLFRKAPYAWQKLAWRRGLFHSLAAHGLCYVCALALLTYCWALREGGALSRLALSLPLLAFLWASHGGPPLKTMLARRHGAELKD